MRRRLKYIAWALAGVVLLLAGLVVVLVGTGPGTRRVFDLVIPRLPVELSIDHVDGRLAGRLDLRGIRVAREGLEVSVGHFGLDWAPFELVRGRLHLRSVLIEDVEGTLRPTPGAAAEPDSSAGPTQGGPIALPLEVQFDRIEARRIGLRVPGTGQLEDVTVTLRGTPERYQLALQAHLEPHGAPVVDVDLEGEGDLARFGLKRLSLNTLDGVVEAQGTATWYPDLTWELTVDARDLAVGQLAPEPGQWPGRVGLRLHSRGSVEDGQPQGTVALDSLSGSIRDFRLEGGGAAEFLGPRARIDSLFVQWANVRVDLQGRIEDQIDLDLRAAAPGLGLLGLGWEGEAEATARLEGPISRPRGRLSLAARDLAGAGLSLARLQLDATGTADLEESLRLGLEVTDLRREGQRIAHTSLQIEGTPASHRIVLDGTGTISGGHSPLGTAFELSAEGGFDAARSAWQGTLSRLNLSADSLGTWSLETPASVMAGGRAAAVDSLCLVRDMTRLRLGGRWAAPMNLSATLALTAFPLQTLRAFLPEGRSPEGLLEASLTAEADSSGRLLADAELSLESARLLRTSAGDADTLFVEPVRLTARVDEEGTRANVEAAVRAGGLPASATIGVEVSLPELDSVRDSLPEQPLVGRVQVDIPDLAFVDMLLPGTRATRGSISADVELSGSVARPLVSGSIRTRDVGTELPEMGLALRDVRFEATGQTGSGLEVRGELASGEGSLSLDGRIPNPPSKADPARITIRGQRFLVMNTAEIESEISPDLEMRFDGERLDVRGSLLVPRTRVELVEVPPSAVTVSPDAVIVGPESEPAPPPLETRVDVSVELGDAVYFRGFGAFAHLEGGLRVMQDVPNPPIGSGEVRIVDGSYRAYGQDLKIEDGRIIFAGPLENPRLDIKAFRVADDGTEAGVQVRGTPEQPELRVYSEPAMSEGRALTYLLTGHAPAEGSGSTAGSMATLLGSNVLSSQVGSSLGLDEARVESGDDLNEATLVAGKYLSPELYVAYAKSLFDATRAFRIRYLFSRSWSVQAETGSAMGADVFYNFERGGR